ncbi:MAG: hypothetical protein RLZZ490_1286 [Cyanobacteriota bacterium]|jgi:hypothetical protein
MESNVEQKTVTPGVKTDLGSLATEKKGPITDQAWQEWLQPVWDVLGKVPELTGQFFDDNKQPLISLGIIVLGIVSVKILIAVLDAINDIPLLAPMLQLIGMGYTAWFIWRYLWKASNRQELVSELGALKDQIFGS